MDNIQNSRGDRKNRAYLKRNTVRGLFIGAMLSVGLIQFAIFWVYVNFDSILMGFQIKTKYGTDWGFDNFAKFFHDLAIPDLELGLALKNTVLLYVVGTLIGLPVSLLFAYFLYKKIKFSKFFRVVFFLPSIISSVVLVTLFKYIFGIYGPVNEIIGLITGKPCEIEWIIDEQYSMNTILFYVFWMGFGGNIVLLTGAIHRIPTDVIEYAEIDGVGMARELVQIIIPMIWPTLSTLLVFATAGLFTNSGPVLLFTEGQYKTMTIGYFIFNEVQFGSYNYPAAIGLVFTVIGFPLVLLVKFGLSKIFEDVEY